MRRRFCQFCLPHALCLLTACFLGFTALVTVSPLVTTEEEILLQFKGNITNDPYNSLATWVPSGSPCEFSGVFCNSVGLVERVVLWNTSLSGVLSPGLSGLRSLRILTLYGNQFTGTIPPEYSELSTLWKINLSSNALSGSIPEFIGDLPNIRFLDLSRNRFDGLIPSALFKFCFRTKFVSFAHNSLSGSIPLSIVNCVNLEGFDFSFNNLSGELPPRICDIPLLQYMSLRSNVLTGNVQEEIETCQRLSFLDLGSNGFTGLAPFGVIGLQNMTYFNVSQNGFRGNIPEFRTCSERLEIFDASGNGFDGVIPPSITNCRNLLLFDVGFNRLNGVIPVQITQLTRLLVFNLGNNSIAGTIPAGFGSIELLLVLDFHNLNLVGQIPQDISNCKFLRELDVSGNSLDGQIPETLSNITSLEVLDLHGNHFNGTIPSSFGNFSMLKLLDLSENGFSGSIPASLGNLSNLTHLNLSSNTLSGQIPSTPTLQAFGPPSFLNNSDLCGPPLQNPCNGSATPPAARRKSKVLSTSVIVAIIAASLILLGVCMVSIMNIRARGRDDEVVVVESTPPGSSSTDSHVKIGKLVLYSKSLPSKHEDWWKATRTLFNKEFLLGRGSLGPVYRRNFNAGLAIAVKKLQYLGRIRTLDEFEHEIGPLANLRHPNLVPLHGYYWSSSVRLMFTEFYPNGSLDHNLRGSPEFPSTSTAAVGNAELHYWSRRFQIALGTARALSFLHHDCKPPILHFSIKATNILLDENYGAKLSDYGLGKLLPILDPDGSTSHSAAGYVAPELVQSLRVSEKVDVYSFGVILLELVTGKAPVLSFSNEVMGLRDYVRRVLENGPASDCFDGNLRDFPENEVVQVMKLGLICTSEAPSRRPSMAEVVQVLESIRNGAESS